MLGGAGATEPDPGAHCPSCPLVYLLCTLASSDLG